MTPDPITADSSDTAAKARSVMMRRKIDQLPILEVKKLVGVITSDAIVFSMLLPVVERENKGACEREGLQTPYRAWLEKTLLRTHQRIRFPKCFRT